MRGFTRPVARSLFSVKSAGASHLKATHVVQGRKVTERSSHVEQYQEREQGGGADSPVSHFLARGSSEPGCFSHASHLRFPFCGEQTPAPQGEPAGHHTVPAVPSFKGELSELEPQIRIQERAVAWLEGRIAFDWGAGETLEPSCPFLDYHMGICTPQEGTQECQTLKNPPITLLPGLSHRARLGIFPLHFFFTCLSSQPSLYYLYKYYSRDINLRSRDGMGGNGSSRSPLDIW